jgi:hypothetical protein
MRAVGDDAPVLAGTKASEMEHVKQRSHDNSGDARLHCILSRAADAAYVADEAHARRDYESRNKALALLLEHAIAACSQAEGV